MKKEGLDDNEALAVLVDYKCGIRRNISVWIFSSHVQPIDRLE